MRTLNLTCCTAWNGRPILAAAGGLVAVGDGYPVTPGHTLIIPTRHVDRFTALEAAEAIDLLNLVWQVQQASDATSFSLGVNDGPDAGRTVEHFHFHVAPRRPGDVPDKRGGFRQIFHRPDDDPWLRTREGDR